MQIERHLYKIFERSLSNEFKRYCKIVSWLLIILTAVFALATIYGHVYILPNNLKLTNCLKNVGANIDPEGGHVALIMSPSEFAALNITQYGGQVINTVPECTYAVDLNFTSVQSDLSVIEFTFDRGILLMDQIQRRKLGFKTHYFIINNDFSSITNVLYSRCNLFMNEFISNKEAILMTQRHPKVFIAYPGLQAEIREGNGTTESFNIWNLFISIKNGIITLSKTFLCYLMVSIMTSFYIYGTISSAPAVIILSFFLFRNLSEGIMREIFRMFPWLGIHMLVRTTSPSPKIARSTTDVPAAVFQCFICTYLLYYAIQAVLSMHIISSLTVPGLVQLLFGYIATVQFCAILFMRTRIFLKYFPVLHTLIMVGSLLYYQFCLAGFKILVCATSISLSSALFAYFLSYTSDGEPNFDGNPRPTLNMPRACLLPVFTMSWISSLPSEWTMLVPHIGRENFTERQLSLVDENLHLLNEGRRNRPEPNPPIPPPIPQ